MKLLHLFLRALFVLSVATHGRAVAETILLVDDHDVFYRSGTKRVLHSPVRHSGNPLIVGPNVKNQIGASSVYRDPASGRYQLWYQLGGGDRGVAYAESEDGIKWTLPELGLIKNEKIQAGNLVLESHDHYGATVVVDPPGTGDPLRRYKMMYCSIPAVVGKPHPRDARAPNGGMFVAFSPDGIHWTKHPDLVLRVMYGPKQAPPLVGEDYPWGELNSVSDVLDLTYDPVSKKYLVYSKGWIDGPDGLIGWKRTVVRSESDDFINWSKPQLMIAPDEHDGVRPWEYGGSRKGVQLHSASVFIHHGIYLGLLQVADYETHGQNPIELVVSRNGVDWTRPFRTQMFIPVGESSQFDAGRIWANSTPVFLEDEIRFYYGAYEHPWKFSRTQPYPWNAKTRPPLTGLGLAVLKRDRFAGVRPIEKIGQITMKPRQLKPGVSIQLNADASKGIIRVELLNERGYRIPGFTKEDSVPIDSDGLRHAVKWKNSTQDLAEGAYMIRLYLESAEVFAVTLQ